MGVVALVAVGTAANAADLATRPYTKAPITARVYNWSGFYAGVMGGYGWQDKFTFQSAAVPDTHVRGGFGGGQIGYNWQFGGPWVFGIEVDAAGAGIQYYFENGTGTEIRSLGSVTGRMGWAFGPTLLYAKGGWGWADNKLTAFAGFGGGPLSMVSDSQVHSGWTAGAGAEYMFAPAWSAKIEYMYADYGDKNYFKDLARGASAGLGIHTVKAGINYHFN